MKKTTHYRRVIWLGDEDHSLQAALTTCFAMVEGVAAPQFHSVGLGSECVVARRTDNNGVFVHLVVYEPGAPAAVVGHTPENPGTTDEREPDPGEDYIRSQLCCFVRENDLVWMGHNDTLRERSVETLLSDLIDSLSGTAERSDFVLQPQVDRDVFRRILGDGIEEIDLGVGALASELEYIANDGDIGGSGFLAALSEIFGPNVTPDEIRAAAKVRARLYLRPGKAWDNEYVREMLANAANRVVDRYDEEFTIVTKKKHRITQSKMTIQKAIEVAGNKRLISAAGAEAEMRAFLDELAESDILG